jgi:hypothetical protein
MPRSWAHKVAEIKLVRNENFLGTADKLLKDTDSWAKNLKDKILQNQDYHCLFGSLSHEGVSDEQRYRDTAGGFIARYDRTFQFYLIII